MITRNVFTEPTLDLARAALAEWRAAHPTRECSRISVTHDADAVQIEINWTEGDK